MGSWQTISVAVADIQPALALWVSQMGMTVVFDQTGPDESLAMLWDIAPTDIKRQVLLSTSDNTVGQLHLVEFESADAPIRKNAQAFDWVPKNLDIYVEDMPARIAELKNAGYTFSTDDFSEISAPNGMQFREIHMPSHDAINVVLLELIGVEQPMTEKHYGAVGPLITIVPDAQAENAFVQSVLKLEELSHNILKGPEIEAMIGLPVGAALDVSIWGKDALALGQIEVIEYQGTQGNNLYDRIQGRATGIRQIRFAVKDLNNLIARLNANDTAFERYNKVSLLGANGDLIVFHTPAGLRIEAIESHH
ncbi:MAG: VOC family protein [Woeseiaceae bacterium]